MGFRFHIWILLGIVGATAEAGPWGTLVRGVGRWSRSSEFATRATQVSPRAVSRLSPVKTEPEDFEALSRLLKRDFFNVNASLPETRLLTDHILKRFPPDQYFYLGVGRSPTLIMADLKSRGLEIKNLPLGAFRYEANVRKFSLGKSTYPLPKELESTLDDHFSRFLPTSQEIAGRKVLLIDQTDSGKSLASAVGFIDRYYRSQGQNVNLKPLAILENRTQSERFAEKLVFPRSYSVAQIHKDSAMARGFRGQSFDDLAEYNTFHIDRAAKWNSERNLQFDELVRSFRALASQ